MLKRHEDQLMQRLDELYANGTTYITWGELYHWYNVQRISKTPWRDLKARWDALLDEKGESPADPHVAQLYGGVALFFGRQAKRLGELAS